MRQRAMALVGALVVDIAFDEADRRWHPVAATGALLDAGHHPFRGRSARTQMLGGAAALGAVAALVVAAARAAERGLGRRQIVGAVVLAFALKPTFSLRQLLAEGVGVARALDRGDVEGARVRLRALVSRPVDALDHPLIASAAIESLAENLADSVVAPLLYYAVLGLPGAALYRVVNTADAMYGYRGELEWLGKVAARADDVLNWLPSRLSAVALVLAAAATRGVPAVVGAISGWRADASSTASPNAGRPMAVMAGALHRRLEKPGHYILGGDNPQPRSGDVRAAALITGVAAGLAVIGVLAMLMTGPD
ncbi:MAG: adenosylcobinamide-phosphate synthase CbiB [Candidatus Dormibacteria bacterium]